MESKANKPNEYFFTMNTSRLNINFFLILIAFTLFGSFSYAEQKKPIEKLKFTPDIYIKANKFKVIKAEEKKKNLTLWIEDGFSTLPFRENMIKAVKGEKIGTLVKAD